MAEYFDEGPASPQHQQPSQLQAAFPISFSILSGAFGVLASVFWVILGALYYIVFALLSVLKLLYRPIGFLLQPLLHIGRFILACLAAPFYVLARFETLYIYLGIAALVGLTVGLANYYIYGWLQGVLALQSSPDSPPGRTAREYRMNKRRQKLEDSTPLMSPGIQHPPVSASAKAAASSPNGAPMSYSSLSEGARTLKGNNGKGLLTQTQTIMEEADSDY